MTTMVKKSQPAKAEEKPPVVALPAVTRAILTELNVAAAALSERRKIADGIATEIAASQAVVAQLDEVAAPSADQLAAQEGARRRIRKLRADAAVAQQQVLEATKPVRALERRLNAAKLIDADHELQMLDAAFVARARAVAVELGALRRTIFQKLQIANALYLSLRPANEAGLGPTPRGTVSGLGSVNDDPLEAAARAIRTLVTRTRQLAEQAQIHRNPINVYRPPRDAQGEFD